MNWTLNRSRSRGFSLVELLVVIAIIIILAAILIVLLAHERDNANVATCETNERMIAEALDSYAVDHSGQYPTSSGPVNRALFGGPTNPYFTTDALIDPANGQPYLYTVGPGTCTNPDAEYQIVDQGGHASSSLIALLSGDDTEDSIAFCSDRGLYAFASGSAGGVGVQPNNNPPPPAP
jgi:prepilin-type N-terminal cleavage/methylation domain-containing protein